MTFFAIFHYYIGASKSSSCSNLNDQNNDDNCNGESKTQDEHKRMFNGLCISIIIVPRHCTPLNQYILVSASGSLIPKHSILKSSVFGSSLLDSPGTS